MTDKIVLWNANLLTMDSGNRRAEALAISTGKIAGVGANEGWRRYLDWSFNVPLPSNKGDSAISTGFINRSLLCFFKSKPIEL